MRRGLVVLAVLGLAGCADASARPTWPRPHARDSDGGESLAPRPAARAIAAAVEDDRPSARASDRPASPGISVAPVTAPAAAPTAAAPTEDEPINTEEIVIEVEGEAP